MDETLDETQELEAVLDAPTPVLPRVPEPRKRSKRPIAEPLTDDDFALVEMKFVGQRAARGGIRGGGGRRYKFVPGHRLLVHPDDVSVLMKTGLWERA